MTPVVIVDTTPRFCTRCGRPIAECQFPGDVHCRAAAEASSRREHALASSRDALLAAAVDWRRAHKHVDPGCVCPTCTLARAADVYARAKAAVEAETARRARVAAPVGGDGEAR